MPQNCIAPKPEQFNSNHSENGPPEMAEPHNSSVVAYPMQTNQQSLPKLIMFPIILKVIHLSQNKIFNSKSANLALVPAMHEIQCGSNVD